MEFMFLAVRPYINTFNDFISLRLINKKSAKIFMEYMSCFNFDKLTFSKRTWLEVHRCSCCESYSDELKEQLVYRMDDPPRRCIVHCANWRCKLIALQTYIYEIFNKNKMVIFYPPIPDGMYNIPRSNTKITTFAKLKWNNIAILNDNGDFNLNLNWYDKGSYRKLVPFAELIKRNTQLKNLTFKIRNIYQELIPEKILYSNPDSVVPAS